MKYVMQPNKKCYIVYYLKIYRVKSIVDFSSHVDATKI
jgi:hypothetical protein